MLQNQKFLDFKDLFLNYQNIREIKGSDHLDLTESRQQALNSESLG